MGKGDAAKVPYFGKDAGRGGAERDSDSGVLSATAAEGEQFYGWQCRLKPGRQEGTMSGPGVNEKAASFALVGDEARTDAGLSWCWTADAGCASARGWMKRRCARCWALWSRAGGKFSSSRQGVPVHGTGPREYQ
jgi:hypothetical protein